MARVQLPIMVIDPATGLPVNGATVTVTARATGSAASVYAAESGGTAGTNILTTDVYGKTPNKWVNRGAYNLAVSGTGITTYTQPWDAAPAADSSVDSTWIAPGEVATSDLAAGAVTVAKLDTSALMPYYATLPAGTSWTDGQQITLPNPAGGSWLLRWSSAGSWHFVGGAPGYNLSTSSLTLSSTMTAQGATFTLPNKGRYLIEAVAFTDVTGGTTTAPGFLVGVGTSATEANTAGYYTTGYVAGNANGQSVSVVQSRDVTTTGVVLNVYGRLKSGTTSGTISSATIKVTPVYLTP